MPQRGELEPVRAETKGAAVLHQPGPDGSHPLGRNRPPLFRFQGPGAGHVATGTLFLGRTTRHLPQHGGEAGWTGPAIRGVLPQNANAPLDLRSRQDRLSEIATRERLAPFYTPALLVSDERLLVQVVRDQGGQIFSMNLDGSDAREFTRLGEGLPYGLSLSPDGHRVAYHLASPRGYEIWTSDVDGSHRLLVAGHPDHLYFGPSFSPDGQWLLFQDCSFKTDPGHDWCDLCLASPDGSDKRTLTQGQAMWFAATYGNPETRGGGSNVACWTRDGQVLFPQRLPGAKVAWEFQAQRPDTDHFNRDFKPEQARGGTEVCRLNPHDGEIARLTHNTPAAWDFRASESPDGQAVVFCRAQTGGTPEIRVMDSDGRNQRLLTRGFEDKGADHPRWLPLPQA